MQAENSTLTQEKLIAGAAEQSLLHAPSEGPDQTLERAIHQVRHCLPLQNPLAHFIHNNPFQAFEVHDFSSGLAQALSWYGVDGCVSGAQAWELSYRPSRAPWVTNRQRFDRAFEDVLVPIAAIQSDQGMSFWPRPYTEAGDTWRLFEDMQLSGPRWPPGHLRGAALGFLSSSIGKGLRDLSPSERLLKILEQIGIPTGEWGDYLTEMAFVLRGWSGLIHRLETQPALRMWEGKGQYPIRLPLEDWLSVLLAVEYSLNRCLNLEPFRIPTRRRESLRIRDEVLQSWKEREETDFRGARSTYLSAKQRSPHSAPSVQMLVCMDDRESFLRAEMERRCPEVETFGTVGFFGVDMWLHRVGAPAPVAQCPPVITPQHSVFEVDPSPLRGWRSLNARFRAKWLLRASLESQTLVRGAVWSMILGLLAIIPTGLSVYFPRLRMQLAQLLAKRRAASLWDYEGPSGFSLEAQVRCVEWVLRTTGMNSPTAPTVVVLAHGSTTTNNPYRNAYGCGACSGRAGGPNAEIFASMANDERVRVELKKRGIDLRNTRFFAAEHDTTSDQIRWLAPWLPDTDSFRHFQRELADSAAANSARRIAILLSGRTDSVFTSSTSSALQRVEARALSPAEPRPEYGHSGVAGCWIGPRRELRGQHFDSRFFTISYDSAADDDCGTWLEQVMQATLPVATNIVYDYFTSALAPNEVGAGSKLPLNITGMLGVMTGSKSDLRIGLPRQVVEIHHLQRPQVFVVAPMERIQLTLSRADRLARLVRHEWIRVFAVEGESFREVRL